MGWLQNIVDFVKDAFTTPDSNEQQHVGWNIVLPTPTQDDVNAAYASSKPTTTPTTTPSTTTPTTTPSSLPLSMRIRQEMINRYGYPSFDSYAAQFLNPSSNSLPIPFVPTFTSGSTGEGGDGGEGGDTGGGGDTGSGYSSSGNAQSAYDAQLKAIEEQRAYAEKLAEQARQEAIKNAYINYDRSLSTYGQNAERLAQMGLTNSGYSDYLDGVAYSSMVGGVQDAHKTANEAIERAYYNASQQKAEAADTLYNRQLQQQQMDIDKLTAQATKFENLLSEANYGGYTANQINILAKTFGLTDEQTNVLLEAVKDYEDYIEQYKNSIGGFFNDEEAS